MRPERETSARSARNVFVAGLLCHAATACTTDDATRGRGEPRIDFENAVVLCDTPPNEPVKDRCALYSDAEWFNLPMKGYRREKSLTFVHDGFGGDSIAEFRIAPTGPDADSAMDKLMVEMYGVYARSDVMPAFDETRYYAFSMRLAEDFEEPDPGSTFIVWQLWQGSPYSPPVRLEIGQGDVLRLGVRNDITGGKSEPLAGMGTDLRDLDLDSEQAGVQPLDRNVWHRIVVGVLPRHYKMAEYGVVKVWIDDLDPKRPLVSIDDSFVGYDPEGWAGSSARQRESGDERPLPRFDTSFGIYRTRQLKSQAVFFADAAVAGDLDGLR